jgi:hypothetical protein
MMAATFGIVVSNPRKISETGAGAREPGAFRNHADGEGEVPPADSPLTTIRFVSMP